MGTMIGHQIRRARNIFEAHDSRRATMMCEGYNRASLFVTLKIRPFSYKPHRPEGRWL